MVDHVPMIVSIDSFRLHYDPVLANKFVIYMDNEVVADFKTSPMSSEFHINPLLLQEINVSPSWRHHRLIEKFLWYCLLNLKYHPIFIPLSLSHYFNYPIFKDKADRFHFFYTNPVTGETTPVTENMNASETEWFLSIDAFTRLEGFTMPIVQNDVDFEGGDPDLLKMIRMLPGHGSACVQYSNYFPDEPLDYPEKFDQD